MPVVCNLWVGGLPRQMTLAAPEAFPEMLCTASTSTCEVPFVSTWTDRAFSPLPRTAEARIRHNGQPTYGAGNRALARS